MRAVPARLKVNFVPIRRGGVPWMVTLARLRWISLWVVGQAPRPLRESVFPRQAGRLPYNRKRGLPGE